MKVFLYAVWGQILFNGYIVWYGSRALVNHKKICKCFWGIIIFEMSLYFIGFFFHKYLPEKWLDIIVIICNTWYIASIYVSIGFFILDMIMVINRVILYMLRVVHVRHFSALPWQIILVFIIVILLMIKAYNNAMYPVIKEKKIHIAKNAESRDHLTIVLISDLHLSGHIGKKHLQRYVRLCNAQNPDIVVIPGDLIDYESNRQEREHLEKEFLQFNAPMGVYITLGNHEYRANRYAKMKWLQKTGATILVDSIVMPDSSFYLIGRDDAVNKRRLSLTKIMKNIDISKPIILLDHQPRYFSKIVMNKIDLSLHGHTHNGQIWPNNIMLSLLYECSYGYYCKGVTQFYVTSGIGFAGPPYRIQTRSEIVVLHITFDKITS